MRRTKTRVTMILAPQDGREQHRLGVNSLAYSAAQQRLYTCGRDSTVRAWDVANGEAVDGGCKTLDTSMAAFHGHTDWVNDGVLCDRNDERLLTASSDASIRLWNTLTGECLASAVKHMDYVKALAYACDANIAVSAGLDKTLHVLDLATMIPVVSSTSGDASETAAGTEPTATSSAVTAGTLKANEPDPSKHVHKSAIYSVAVNNAGTVVAFGSPEKTIRLWDPRTGKRIAKLAGHTDNVKTLLLDATGTLCLSGSSDATVKLWDIAQQRCLITYTMHNDSVFSLAADQHFNKFCSASKDGDVFSTDRALNKTVLLLKETAPVSKIAYGHNDDVWVATSRPVVEAWRGATSADFEKGTSDHVDYDKPLSTKPIFQIKGSPGLVKQALVNSKSKLITADSTGQLESWDILTGREEKISSATTLEKAVQEQNDVVWVPNWFASDIKIGVPSIHFDEQSCYNADLFVVDTDLSKEYCNEETRINLGQYVLSTLFKGWRQNVDERAVQLKEKEREKDLQREQRNNGSDGESPASPAETTPPALSKSSSQGNLNDLNGSAANASTTAISGSGPVHTTSAPTASGSSSSGSNGFVAPAPAEAKDTSFFGRLRNTVGLSSPAISGTKSPAPSTPSQPPLSSTEEPSNILSNVIVGPYEFPPETTIVITEESTVSAVPVVVFRCRVADLVQRVEELERVAPVWLIDCVLKERIYLKDPPKFNFVLMPEDEKDLPQLPIAHRRLNGSRILRVRKIIVFVLQKLKLDEKDAELRYELLCNDTVLKPGMNLGTIRNCLWKSGNDLQLTYRRRKPTSPQPASASSSIKDR